MRRAFLLLGLVLALQLLPPFPKIVSTSLREEWDAVLTRTSIANVVRHVERLTLFGTRDAFMEQCNESARFLFGYFSSLPRFEVSLHHFDLRGGGSEGTYTGMNVVARKNGSEPGEMVVLCAHYDSISIVDRRLAPGANDDAAGVAVLMEVARVLSACELDRTVVFLLFSGEEWGLQGSAAWVEENSPALVDSVTICLDGVGRGRMMLLMHTLDSSRTLARCVHAVGASLGCHYFQVAQRPSIGSDSESFEDGGFQAVRLWDMDTTYIHTPEDTPDTLNSSRIGEVMNVTAAASYVLSRYGLEGACKELGVLGSESAVGVGHLVIVLLGVLAVLIVTALLWRVERSTASSPRISSTRVSQSPSAG